MKKTYKRPQIVVESFEITANILDVSPTNATIGVSNNRRGNSGRAEARERGTFDSEEEWGDMW